MKKHLMLLIFVLGSFYTSNIFGMERTERAEEVRRREVLATGRQGFVDHLGRNIDHQLMGVTLRHVPQTVAAAAQPAATTTAATTPAVPAKRNAPPIPPKKYPVAGALANSGATTTVATEQVLPQVEAVTAVNHDVVFAMPQAFVPASYLYDPGYDCLPMAYSAAPSAFECLFTNRHFPFTHFAYEFDRILEELPATLADVKNAFAYLRRVVSFSYEYPRLVPKDKLLFESIMYASTTHDTNPICAVIGKNLKYIKGVTLRGLPMEIVVFCLFEQMVRDIKCCSAFKESTPFWQEQIVNLEEAVCIQIFGKDPKKMKKRAIKPDRKKCSCCKIACSAMAALAAMGFIGWCCSK